MPLFMFVSGCLFVNVKEIKIVQKIKLLVIPFILWAGIDSLLFNRHADIFDNILNVIYQPDLGLWFLWVLFWIMISVFFLKYYMNDLLVSLSIILIVLFCYILSFLFNVKCFGIGLYGWQIIFFVSGMYFYKYKKHISELNCNYFSFFLMFTYTFSLYYWERDVSLINIFDVSILNKIFGLSIKYISALSLVFLIALNWNKYGDIFNNRICVFFSKNSLAFYAIQFLVIHYILKFDVFENLYVDISFIFIVTLLFSTVFIFVVNKCKYIRIPLFGR